MGVRHRNRVVNDKPVIPPKDIDINDEGYRGQHPDAINYPHQEVVSDGKRSLELKAFTTKGMAQLKRIAEEQFLPLLEAENLNCAVLCEKRRDSGTGRITLGVCFNAGKAAQERGERQAIMLRHPDADDPRVAAVLIHETAHLQEANHALGFRALLGEMTSRAVADGTPFSQWRLDLLALAKGDRYKPIAPQGTSWDDWFNGTPSLGYAVSPDQLGFDAVATKPAAGLTVDASFGVENWGFREELMPRRDPAAIAVEVNLQELVDDYLRLAPSVLEDTGSGGFQWDTDSLGIALAELYDRKLRERGVAQRRINKLRQAMDFSWGIKQNLQDIEPVLDAEVRKRRADAEEVPF